MRNETCALILAFAAATLFFAQPATAALAYPRQPLEIISPYMPGASIDTLGRIVADIAPKYFGQPVVVVSKPGAAGSLAAADVIASKPDGYKLLVSAQVFFATTIRTQKIPFDANDLVPLANFMEMRLVLCVKADSPLKTFNDLLDYARKNPGQLRWSHAGRGITPHMSGMIIFKKAGVQTVDVPYKGGAEALAAILGGHVDVGSSVYGVVSDQVKAGKVRLLMFYTDKRYKDYPNVPTAAELGYPDAVLPTYVGLYVHKNTPETIKKTLMDTCRKIYDDPKLKRGIEMIGEEPKWGGPDFIRESIKKQQEIGIPVLKEIGLYVEK